MLKEVGKSLNVTRITKRSSKTGIMSNLEIYVIIGETNPTSMHRLQAASFSFSSASSSSSDSASSSSESEFSLAVVTSSVATFGSIRDGSDISNAVNPFGSFIVLSEAKLA